MPQTFTERGGVVAILAATLARPSGACAAPSGDRPDVQWELGGGNPDNRNFSPLRDIDEASIGRLGRPRGKRERSWRQYEVHP